MRPGCQRGLLAPLGLAALLLCALDGASASPSTPSNASSVAAAARVGRAHGRAYGRALSEPFAPRAVAIDMDDCLLTASGRVGARTISALAAFGRSGGLIVVTTGRAYAHTLAVMQTLESQGVNAKYLVCMEGALVMRKDGAAPDGWSQLWTAMRPGSELPLQELREAFPRASFVAEVAGRGIIVDGGYAEILKRMSNGKFVERCEEEWQLDPHFDTTVLSAAHVSWLRVVPPEGSDGDAAATRVAAVLAEYAPDGGLTSFGVAEGSIDTVFIFCPANKKDALQMIADKESIASGEFLSFGDGDNDVGMLGWSGQSVSPSNGMPAAKLAAGRVSALSNEEDFIADALAKALGEAFFISEAFPMTTRVKIIGLNEGDFAGDMLKMCCEVTGEVPSEVTMTYRDKGKYRSLTIELRFADQEMMRAVYAAINLDKRVKFKL